VQSLYRGAEWRLGDGLSERRGRRLLDNCGIVTRLIDGAASKTFTCADAVGNGQHSVTLTLKDACNNLASCNAIVTVVDNTPPVPHCQNLIRTLGLDGTVTVNAAEVNNISTDNCGVTELKISKDGGATYGDSVTFNCSELGARVVKLRVRMRG